METLVDVIRLRKAYRSGALETPVLRDLSVGFARGSFTAVVGPSGCGKTTLLSILGGLDQGDAGEVIVDGLDLVAASPRELTAYRRRQVGIVFQFYNLLPSLTALENVESGLELLPMRAAARRRRAMEYLARVGLAHAALRFPAQLSGGEQQRVAVARALAREPKIVLADEPTGNLDQEAGERVFSSMRALQRELGATCIMVTHDEHLAARADAVVRLRDGSLAATSQIVEIARAREESGLRLAGSWR